jgi:predicted ester cyclase
MSEQDVLVVRRFINELWNGGRFEVADELMAPEHIHYLSGDEFGGPQEVKELVAYLRDAFPDLVITIEDEVVGGDKVVIRWTARGTHLGEFNEISPTGRVVTWTGIDIVRLRDHLIVQLWGSFDAAGLYEQLGS